MEQYIPKSVLVAEIEKLRLCTMDEHMGFYSAEAQGEYNALSKLESSLDTFEVKEVDLEKSISDWLSEGLPNDEEKIDYIKETAKYFFELGIKSKSSYVGIPNIDDTLKEMGVDPDSKSAKSFRESYFRVLDELQTKQSQKGEQL